MKKKMTALLYGDNFHYLDHLAPLCYFLNIDLITNVEDIKKAADLFYPKINTILVDNIDIHFYIVKNFNTIISPITKDYFDNSFRFHQDILKKEIEIIWVPHGNSDKGKTILFFEALKKEKTLLLYGQSIIDILKNKKVLDEKKNFFIIGNYRLKFYELFEKFYKKLINKIITKKFLEGKKNILYAPTWEDMEDSSSFSNFFEKILKNLPEEYNLLIKLHPNLNKKYFTKILLTKETLNKPNVIFLDDLPIIYPILDLVDIYLGDFSSIGYDFLFFQKPMFFLPSKNKKLKSDLYECGILIGNDENIFQKIKKNIDQENLNEKREQLYNYTFEKKVDLRKLKDFCIK